MIDRRQAVLGGAALALAGLRGRPAGAADLSALAAAAAAEAPVTWYESSPTDQVDRIARSFTTQFPTAKLRSVRLVGGLDIVARLVNESQAGTPSADVATGGTADGIWGLHDRGLLGTADWAALGVPPALARQPFTLVTAAVTHVIVYNTRLVSEAAAPKDWDDLLDPRWDGVIGTWAGSQPYTQLAWLWGEARVDDYVERLARLRPLLFKSQFTLAQAVASGEVLVGVAAHHTLVPTLAAGAPIRIVVPDPASVSPIYSFFLRSTRSPNAARLFLAWLASADGAKAYEDATGRGTHLVYDTRTAALLRGRRVSEFPPEERARFYALVARHTAILRAGGKDAG